MPRRPTTSVRAGAFALHTVALAAAVCAGCTGDDGGAAPDAGGDRCTRPVFEPAWMRPLLETTVADLTASPRASQFQREVARTYLSTKLGEAGWTARRHAYPTGENVYAIAPATTGTSRQLVIGAHFDTVAGSPGASDNATGTAAVLALARYLVEVPCRDAAVVLVFFDQEEVGLLGSRAFAATLAVPDVIAVHTIDQVGWDADGDRRFEIELPTPALEAAYQAAAVTVGALVSTTQIQGTDHQAFRELGMPAVGLTEEFVGGDTSPHRHTAQDIAATVDLDYLVLATQLVAEVAFTVLSP
jgi:hypothetical protein